MLSTKKIINKKCRHGRKRILAYGKLEWCVTCGAWRERGLLDDMPCPMSTWCTPGMSEEEFENLNSVWKKRTNRIRYRYRKKWNI